MPRKRPYDQFCPIATALDVVGDRWTLLIARELLVGPVRYRELQTALGSISTDVLATRLREMESSGLLASVDGGYILTGDGLALIPILRALGGWGAPRLGPPGNEGDLTATRAVQMLVVGAAPTDESHTIELRCGDLVIAVTADASGMHARRQPATDPEVVITTDAVTLWRVGTAALTWAEAIDSGGVQVAGDGRVAERMLAGRLPGLALHAG